MFRVPEGCVPPPMRCSVRVEPRYAPISGDINYHTQIYLKAGTAEVHMDGIVRVTKKGRRVMRMKPEGYILVRHAWLDEVVDELWPQIVECVGKDRLNKPFDVDFEPRGYHQNNNPLGWIYEEYMLEVHDWENWRG